MTKCIEVVEMGQTFQTDVTGFIENVVQETTIGSNILRTMIEGDGTYEFDDDFPQTFTLLDRTEAVSQLAAFDRDTTS